MVLEVGMQAPDFSLHDKDGKIHGLSDLNQVVVVYFYPKDDTPGCTVEAQGFSSLIDDFHKAGVEVFGISGLDEISKKKFCEKYDLKLTLLADEDFSVSKQYGVFGDKNFMGNTSQGIFRTTFVVDKDKKIVKVYENVKPAGHAKEVLEFVSGLN